MTRIGLTVDVRFLRIPTQWRRVEIQLGDTTAWGATPAVSKSDSCKPVEIDGWAMRNRFLRLPHDEGEALKFLSDVGIWHAVEDPHISAKVGEQLLDGAYGTRLFFGRATPGYFNDLWREQTHWRSLLERPSELKARFSPPSRSPSPADALRYAVDSRFLNQLPLRIEWRDPKPIAVIETITLQELLIATTHIDLLRGAKFKICKRPDCAIPFSVLSRHPRKYCEWYCGHIESVRKKRKHDKQHTRMKGGKHGKTR